LTVYGPGAATGGAIGAYGPGCGGGAEKPVGATGARGATGAYGFGAVVWEYGLPTIGAGAGAGAEG
jgi:hypothetical protein